MHEILNQDKTGMSSKSSSRDMMEGYEEHILLTAGLGFELFCVCSRGCEYTNSYLTYLRWRATTTTLQATLIYLCLKASSFEHAQSL